MKDSTIMVLLLALVLVNLSAYQASAQAQTPTFVRIDVGQITLLKTMPVSVTIQFTNLTRSTSTNVKANQSLEASATFATSQTQGPFSITIQSLLDNTTIFQANGETTAAGSRILTVPIDNVSVLQIPADKSSVTVSVGSVSANFTLSASATKASTYLISFQVESMTKKLSVSGPDIKVDALVANMPPTVNFTARISDPNSTTLATLSGGLDFVTGTGIDVKANYGAPITSIHLLAQRTPSLGVSHIPNTQIVKTLAVPQPLKQENDSVEFAFGKPSANVTQVITASTSNSTKSSGTVAQPQSQTRPLIDLEPVYAAFKNNLVAIVAIVLVLFAAVVVAKRVIG